MKYGARSCRGFTMIEVLIASAILLAIFAVVLLLLTTTSRSYEDQNRRLNLDQRGREVVNEIARELRMSNLDQLYDPIANQQITQALRSDTQDRLALQFRVPDQFDMKNYLASPASNLSKTIEYRWALAPGEGTAPDGADNDANGLVDEGVVLRTEGGQARRICLDVKKDGLKFRIPRTNPGGATQNQGRVEITLELEVWDSMRKSKIAHTVQTSVELRN
jgi:prepilin-type N-terminal cleavage/methylation domain-containing protein